jgi:glycosyl-4,4'-diaponeurosporenoate acyltransferase
LKFLNLLSFIKFKVFKSSLFVFIIISIIWTLIAEKLPARLYDYKKWLFRERKWEQGGRIYENLLWVKKWKPFLPDISDFLRWRFSKKHLQDINLNYIHNFLNESCKSEFTHWMIILSSFLFMFGGGLSAFFKILVISITLNLPYIIIQRYNRPRLIKLLNKTSYQHYELSTIKI